MNAYLNSTLENNENSIWQKKVLGDHVFGELTQVGYKQCIGLGKRLVWIFHLFLHINIIERFGGWNGRV